MSDKKKKKEEIDITIGEGEPEVVTSQPIDLGALRAEVEGILKQRDEYYQMLRQVSADFDNYKKRNAQLRLDTAQESKREVVTAFLPVLDNLERALEAAKGGEGGALTAGVEMVLGQFHKALADFEVQEIASGCGEAFDPEVHNAIAAVPADDEHADNTIFDTMQKGYKLGDRVIRYAMVRVAKSEA